MSDVPSNKSWVWPSSTESELSHLRSRNEELKAENARLRDLIDRACNALTDSICVSGNDRQTNLHWVRKLEREALASPPDSEPAEGAGDDKYDPWNDLIESGGLPEAQAFYAQQEASPRRRDAPLSNRAEEALSRIIMDGVDTASGPIRAQTGDEELVRRAIHGSCPRILAEPAVLKSVLQRVREYADAIGGEWAWHQGVMFALRKIRELDRTSDEGGVAEAVMRLPGNWRKEANMDPRTYGRAINRTDQRWYDSRKYHLEACANQLDRAIAQSEQGCDEDVSAKYHELLYAVATKHPGESRHETALRYIRQAENRLTHSQGGEK